MADCEHVTRKVVAVLLEAGYSLSLHDGEEWVLSRSKDAQAIDAALFHTDDIFIKAEVKGAKGIYAECGWVQLYFENGYECIHDYTVNMEEVLKPAIDYAESLA